MEVQFRTCLVWCCLRFGHALSESAMLYYRKYSLHGAGQLPLEMRLGRSIRMHIFGGRAQVAGPGNSSGEAQLFAFLGQTAQA